MNKNGTVHEPEAELLSAEDAVADLETVRGWFQRKRAAEQATLIPLHVLLEAIDHLEPEALRDVVQRAQERLERAA